MKGDLLVDYDGWNGREDLMCEIMAAAAGLGPRRGAHVALVVDTHPDFVRYFFACQYAALVPVPLPAPSQIS